MDNKLDRTILDASLWINSPFFGPQPEGLVLLQIDLDQKFQGADIQQVIELLIQSFIAQQPTKLRWQIGVGSTLFERITTLPSVGRPRALKPLLLNGDESSGLKLGSGESDFLISIGGEWENIVQFSRELCGRLVQSGVVLRGVHFGHAAGNPRGHSGFIDGTSNLQELNQAQFSQCVFVQPEDDQPFVGGTYLVFRKYEENLEVWNDLPDFVQEKLIGRRKHSGNFLNQSSEWTSGVWAETSPNAHIRRTHPREISVKHPDHWKERIYRRSIKFTERNAEGSLRYGLLFIALVRDPEVQFVRIHNERLLPIEGLKDYFLSSGYIKPLCTACYFLPKDVRSLKMICQSL